MTNREKLIELLSQVQDYGEKHTNEQWSVTVETKCNATIADHMISNGVTVQKWIPVTERFPEVHQRILVYCESKTIEKHVTTCTYTGGLYGRPQFSRHCRDVTH